MLGVRRATSQSDDRDGRFMRPWARSWAARRLLGAGTLALALALSACGGGSSASEGGNNSGPDTIKLGVIPIVDVAPIYLGIKKGYFDQENIKLDLSSGQGGAAIVPGVASGNIDVGFGNNTSLLLAVSKGLPLKVAASGVYSTGKPGHDYVEIMVRANSPLHSAADLAGKTVAVNTLNNIGDTTVRASVRAAGADPDAVHFVEMPFPNMNAALAKGEVDAIWQVEPFLALAKREGDRSIATPFTDTAKDLMISTYFTSNQFAGAHPDIIKRFKSAVDKSLTYAQAHPDEVRAIIPSYLDVPKDVIDDVVLPRWSPKIDRHTFEVLIDLGMKDGLLKKKPDLDKVLPAQ